jgi:hypothetical protein
MVGGAHAQVCATRLDVSPRSRFAPDCRALRQGLGSRYNVVSEMGVNVSPLVNVRPDHPDTIVVGTGR